MTGVKVTDAVPNEQDYWENDDRVGIEPDEDGDSLLRVIELEDGGKPKGIEKHKQQMWVCQGLRKHYVNLLNAVCQQVSFLLFFPFHDFFLGFVWFLQDEELSKNVVHVVQDEETHGVHQNVNGCALPRSHRSIQDTNGDCQWTLNKYEKLEEDWNLSHD